MEGVPFTYLKSLGMNIGVEEKLDRVMAIDNRWSLFLECKVKVLNYYCFLSSLSFIALL